MRVAWQMIRERMGKMQAVQEMINVFVASVVSLAVLFILTRLGGKRQIAQMNLFDYVTALPLVPLRQRWPPTWNNGTARLPP